MEKNMNPIVSDRCFNPVTYLQEYFPEAAGSGKNLPHPSEEISGLRRFLDESGNDEMSNCWDYPLTEIGHIIENDLRVVLVEDGLDNFRFFEVPDNAFD